MNSLAIPGVTVVAVTKTFPFLQIIESVRAGYTHIGENRVDEAAEKIELARQNNLNTIIWHMIGHVQSRKVPEVVSLFDRVDSVDSLELADRLNEESKRQSKLLHVLLEVNVAGEQSKYGFTDLDGVHIPRYSHLVIDGLMTMAPFVTNPEENRMIFRSLRSISQTIRLRFPFIGPALSMGTSCDYRVAVGEGATEVRLGEALFGKRSV